MGSKKVLACCKVLARKKYTIAFVESATAGRMCAEFSLSPHSGDILSGGIASYEVFIKEEILKVPHSYIEEFTPESAEVTQALAQQGIKFFKSDVLVACTGLTTPGGSETEEKPVGTMFIHIIHPQGSIGHREVFSGSAEEIVIKTVERVASLITESLKHT